MNTYYINVAAHIGEPSDNENGYNGDYDTTYHDLLHKAKLPTLELGRERSIAILTYKIIHNQAPNYLKDLINCNRNSKI